MHISSKEKRCKINNPSFQFRKLEIEEQIKSKVSRREVIKIRAKVNKLKSGSQQRKPMKPKAGLKRSIKSISLNAICNKTSMKFFCRNRMKSILKFMWNLNRPKIVKTILKKKKT